MNNTEKNGLKALLGAVHAKPEKKYHKSLGELTEAFLNTEDKAERERMLREFKERRTELSEFFKQNPELLNAEAERALLEAISSGNANAALKYLERRDPERWGSDSDGEDIDNTITIVRAGRSGSNG